MKEVKPRQGSLFDLPIPTSPQHIEHIVPSNPDRTPPVLKENEDSNYYTVKPGTDTHWGPVGMEGVTFREKTKEPILGRHVGTRVIGGIVSLHLQIESPVERKGERIWVQKRRGGHGFI